jgi:hypothetical protein
VRGHPAIHLFLASLLLEKECVLWASFASTADFHITLILYYVCVQVQREALLNTLRAFAGGVQKGG